MIDFALPYALWLMLMIPFLGLGIRRSHARRAAGRQSLGLRVNTSSSEDWINLGAMGLAVIALAGPRWGRLPGAELPAGRDIVFLIDLSRSMAAEDAVPNRLGVGVETARSILKGLQPGDRVGVVGFEGSARVRCPLTENLGAVDQALNMLQVGQIQPGGSDLGAALDQAVRTLGGETDRHAGGRSILLISDGEDHEATWPTILPKLEDQGIMVTCVAVGDPRAGATIPTPKGQLIYENEQVITRRVDTTLGEIADSTGGLFLPVGLAAADLKLLDRKTLGPQAERVSTARRPPEPVERYALPLILALILMIAASLPARALRKVTIPRVLMSFAIFAIAAGPTVADLMERGRKAYGAGDIEGALKQFTEARRAEPANAVVHYNIGATLYRIGRVGEAKVSYLLAREVSEDRLKTKIDYALGNIALRMGDPVEAIDHYRNCLSMVEKYPGLASLKADALINKKYAEDLLKRRDPNQDPNDSPSAGQGEKSSRGDQSQSESPPSSPDRPAPSGPPEPKIESNPRPEQAEVNTPEDRLERAVQASNRAKSAFRFKEYKPPAPSASNRKDW